MAKDPAFLFYPGDWLGGTLGMTFEEKGAYMELLILQFNRGHMTSHMIGQVVGQLWDKIMVKFIKDNDGLWYNRRLDEEKIKRNEFISSRKNNLIGRNQHTKKRGHMTSHMEDENENRNVIKDKDEIKLIYPFDSENFMTIWNALCQEKKWRKKSKRALQASLKTLSKYQESEAMQMIHNAIAGDWQSVNPINNKQHGQDRKDKNGNPIDPREYIIAAYTALGDNPGTGGTM